jgi:hypothetical protein
VVTSPPYGRSVHGQVRAEQRTGGGGVEKYDNRYSDDPANLASHGIDDLLAGFTQILAGCKMLLRPGGIVVVTARPWRQRGELVDLPGAVIAAGANAGPGHLSGSTRSHAATGISSPSMAAHVSTRSLGASSYPVGSWGAR